jgi:hypothetical protein
MQQARDIVKNETGNEAYMIHIHLGNVPPKDSWFRHFDAVSGWVNLDWENKAMNDSYHETETEQFDSAWQSHARSVGKGFIPLAAPGFRAPIHPDWPVLTKSPQRFAKQIQIAEKHLYPQQRIFAIYSFNEWYEGAQIEPSAEDDFKYLQTLRDTLAGH